MLEAIGQAFSPFDLEINTLLTKKEERVKSDLAQEAARIIGIVQDVKKENWQDYRSEAAGRLISHFNQGALVLYASGDTKKALQLCINAIQLFCKLGKVDKKWSTAIFQPFINIGRIAGATGDVDTSINVFRDMLKFLQGKAAINSKWLSLQREDYQLMLSVDPDVIKISENVYISDSLRILLINHKLDQVERFVADLPNEEISEAEERQAALILEAVSRARIRTGRYKEAMRSLQKMKEICRSNPTYVASYSLISLVYRKIGKVPEANKIVEQLESYYEQMKCDYEGHVSPLVVRRLLYCLALERFGLGDSRGALDHCLRGLNICNEIGDNVGQIRLLILMVHIARCCKNSVNKIWIRQYLVLLNAIAAQTWYPIERALAYYELAHASNEWGKKEQHALIMSASILQSYDVIDANNLRRNIMRECTLQCGDLSTRQVSIPKIPKSIDNVYRLLLKFNSN